MPQGNSDNLDADEKDSVDVVLKEYGDRDPYDLHNQSQSESPWKDARGNLPKDANSEEVIPIESMGAYYGSL